MKSSNQYSAIPRIAAAVLVTILVTSLHLKAAPYCLALRGNGESQPAHWGALSQLIETMGLPKIQAGGSSASISLMFLDSIAANPWVQSADAEQQKSRAAFLLKSLHGVTRFIKKSVQDYISQLPDQKNIDLQDLLSFLNLNPNSRYFFLMKSYDDIKNGRTLSGPEMKKFEFYSQELKDAVSAIGAFDAESDSSLFFRDGIVNFERLGLGLGKIATYLSGNKANKETSQTFNEFAAKCEPLHRGLTWAELVEVTPICQELFNKNYQSFLKQKLSVRDNFANQKIGKNLFSLPTTAVLTKSAYHEAKRSYHEYHSQMDRSHAETFKLSNPSDLKFGYWGQPELLRKIRFNLKRFYPEDEKSRRFLGLGMTPWLEVLRLSPAEPGLASLQTFKYEGKDAISAGGWSDLHPVLVLKAAGCENVVYVTRKGGESLFGQGVAKRLLGYERSWDYLRTSDPEILRQNRILNNIGDAFDQTSLWSRLFNLANPKSSLAKSLAEADMVLCTNWDKYDVKKEIIDLIDESYRAPFVINFPTKTLKYEVLNSGLRIIENYRNQKDGMPEWPGCQ